ncbi:Glycosyl hydrolase family 65, N-terminal domain [Nonomuraea solani]|uniref:Glycosyl hydrolase family 65, N-terminal domain n=1 Tax=Nonomuraea solani TaxID=1144553 RepID=A0A1H6ERX2_9ACTN|nr:Glycosyl hydrolase family 65, N-terminal domain [Nonomuraea solani]
MAHPPRRRFSATLIVVFTLAAGLPAPSYAAPEPEQTPDDLTLWYDKPATDWETQALPIGNGPLGAMIFGGVASERIQFNEKTLWTGGPGSPGYDHGG